MQKSFPLRCHHCRAPVGEGRIGELRSCDTCARWTKVEVVCDCGEVWGGVDVDESLPLSPGILMVCGSCQRKMVKPGTRFESTGDRPGPLESAD